jgi:hypothetical protein
LAAAARSSAARSRYASLCVIALIPRLIIGPATAPIPSIADLRHRDCPRADGRAAACNRAQRQVLVLGQPNSAALCDPSQSRLYPRWRTAIMPRIAEWSTRRWSTQGTGADMRRWSVAPTWWWELRTPCGKIDDYFCGHENSIRVIMPGRAPPLPALLNLVPWWHGSGGTSFADD